MYLAHVTDENGVDRGMFYPTLDALIADSFILTIDSTIDFTVRGDTYEDRKECVRAAALDYSNGEYPDLSYGELADIESWFRTNGERYGLLDEFTENCIC